MKRFLLLTTALVLVLVMAGCSIGVGSNNRSDLQAVQTRYATVAGAGDASASMPYLADEVTVEISWNLFGQQVNDNVSIHPNDFLADFRSLQQNPLDDVTAGVTLPSTTDPVQWGDAVVSVDGTQATATRSFKFTSTNSLGAEITGTGGLQTFWTKTNTGWKLYKLTHSINLALAVN